MNMFQQDNEMDKMCGGLNLTRTQRFYGFGIAFSVGFLISFFSTFFLWTGKFSAFAILYSIGNIISLIATGFLVGFGSQVKKMLDPTRMAASIAFLVALVCTLISALVIKIGGLTVLCCVVQYVALLWYCLSYIPFARDMVKNTCLGCCK
jgi:hypothetical protein